MARDKKSSPAASGPAPFPAHAADGLNLAIYARRYFQIALRRWPVLVVCTAIGLGYNAYKAAITPDEFRAISLVSVKSRVITGHEKEATVVEATTENSYWNDQVVKIEARPVTDRVFKRLQDKPLPQKISFSASRFQGATFRLAVQGTDFDYVQKFATYWAEEFVKSREEDKDLTLKESAAGTRSQLTELQSQLDRIQESIRDFQKTNAIVDPTRQANEAQLLLTQIKSEYQSKKSLRERLENMSKEEIATGGWQQNIPVGGEQPIKSGANPAVSRQITLDPLAVQAGDSKFNELRSQLDKAQATRAKLLEKLKPAHPKMVEIDEQIAEINRGIDFALNLIVQQKASRLKTLKAEEESYLPQIKAAEENLKRLADLRSQFTELDADRARLTKSIDDMRDRISTIEMARSKNEEQWEVTEKGTGNDQPVSPNRRQMIMRGFLTGFAVGLAIIFLLHRIDDRLDLAEDIERELQEPVLGQVPQMDVKAMKTERLLVTSLPQDDMFAESIRGVRSTVLMTVGAGSKRVFVVTSAVPGDGKTTFTVNFAATLAITGARVLLVDADLRRGSTHLYFGHKRDDGLSDVLGGHVHWTDVIKTTDQTTLGVITSGHLPASPGELLLGPVAAQFIEEARQAYDYVIIDTPPLTSINDTFALVNYSDGLIFVVRAGQTSMRFAKNAIAAIRQREVRVLGLVLNGITADNPYYYYHYYYHAYYTREQKEANAKAVNTAPAKEMAAPRRRQLPSIELEAKSQTGQKVSFTKLADEERTKIEQYKSRRATQRSHPSAESPLASDSTATSSQEARPDQAKS